MAENYTTLGESTLNGGITDSATTIAVADASSFPSTGTFRIKIEDEICSVGGVSVNNLTSVSRGTEGTTAAAHSTGAAVTAVLTASALDAFRADQSQLGAYASLPASAKAGDVYWFSDSAFSHARWNGSTWDYFLPFRGTATPAAEAGLSTWVNQDEATLTETGGVMYIEAPKGAQEESVNARVKSAASEAGLVWRQSSDGKIIKCSVQRVSGNAIDLWVTKNDSAIATNSAYTSYSTAQGLTDGGSGIWLAIADDGTDRTVEFSINGYQWWQYHTVGRTDFLTADQVGVYVNPDTTLTDRIAQGGFICWDES